MEKESRLSAARHPCQVHQDVPALEPGTDSYKPTVIPGFSLHQELQSFVEAGLTPYEAIRAGTSDAAIFLHEENEFGTVALGQRADLLLLDVSFQNLGTPS